MKILFSSHAPFTTAGYSTQLTHIVNGLYSYDPTIEFGFICWDIPKTYLAYSDKPYTFDYISNLCSSKKTPINKFNADIKAKFYMCGERKDFWAKIEIFNRDFKCDKLIVFQDIWPFERYKISQLPCEKYLYMPIHNTFLKNRFIDYKQFKNPEINNLYHFPFFDKIATPSMFGVKVLESYGYTPTLIDHIVEETQISHTKQQIREKYKLDDTHFICLMVARNSCQHDRKAFIEQFKGFALFLDTLSKEERETCRLILHENYSYSLKGWIDLEKHAKELNILDKIIITTRTINSTEHIIQLYKLADVLLCASKSEGFGLPMVEAQIHGTPVITTNCTAMSTNTFYGICTEPEDVTVTEGGMNSWSKPSSKNLQDAITYIYNRKNNKDNSNYNFQLKPINKSRYSTNTILNHWISFLGLKKAIGKGEAMFNGHLSNILPILSKKSIRSLKKANECRYNAVLIDNRSSYKIEAVLLNILYFTNEDIGIQLFYNDENEKYILELINKYNLFNISLEKISNFSFTTQYQEFLFSKEFYDKVCGEKILLFQIDSLLLKPFDMKYFDYDWIGAVWNSRTLNQPPLLPLFKDKLPIGNGGFNIRNINKCRIIAGEIFQYKRPINGLNEDSIYSYLLQEYATVLQSNFPSLMEAMEFSVETIYHPDPMSVHSFHIYLDYSNDGVMYINNIFAQHMKRLINSISI
jgi:glycosyltransferase involved in cell wall biosynthesis